MMDAMLILAIIKKLLTYGPRAVVEIAAAFEHGDPTPEDSRALKIDRDPEEYFK